MKRDALNLVRSAAGLVALIAAGWLVAGTAPSHIPEGIPSDWSHRHVIFSQPVTMGQIEGIAGDARYWQEWYRRNVSRTFAPAMAASPLRFGLSAAGNAPAHGDWSINMGTGASVGAANFPAKYSFGVNAANCSTATSPDYVVFNTGLTGSGTQASIIAFDNLYSVGCSGTVPTVFWAYNTGGQILTSPVISGNGTEVAFAQTSGGAGFYVVLKWARSTGTLTAPVAPTAVPPASFRTCVAPCMTSVALGDSARNPINDTTSSVFPDYTHNVIWVGGASSWLHKITGAFGNSPAEATTGGFPVRLNSTTPTALSSPVYDFPSNQVFVGDLGGFFYRVSATGTVTTTSRLDFGTGLVAGPIVDSTAQKVYVFSSSDGSTACTGGPCSPIYSFNTNFGAGSSWLSTTAVGDSSTTAPAPVSMYEGSFDSTYQSSGLGTGTLYVCGNTGANATLYRVPVVAGVFGTPAAVGALMAAAQHFACSPISDFPSSTGTGERVFFSVRNRGRPINCVSGGCVMSFVSAPWKPSTAYSVGQEILALFVNGTLHTETVITAGTSGLAPPAWGNAAGSTNLDGSVRWIGQGTTTFASLPVWTARHAYNKGNRILDDNNNIQVVSVAGTSGTTTPTFNTTVNGVTVDGAARWVNTGVLPSAAQTYTSGSSGIILDNVVGSLNGASQVYFSPLGNQTCTTSGSSGGCAIQASQIALQ